MDTDSGTEYTEKMDKRKQYHDSASAVLLL